MPVFDIPKLYADGEDLTELELDAVSEYIETALNTTKLDYQNIQSGGIIADNIAAGAVTTSKIALDAVTTPKLADDAVTTSKIVDSNVTTAKIADSNVTTAKIADGAVTQAKRAALGQQISSGSGGFQTLSTTFVDVTNLSVSITTTGRPVILALISDPGPNLNSTDGSHIVAANTVSILWGIQRDSTVIAKYHLQGLNSQVMTCPSMHVDTPVAGTYTYKVIAWCASPGGSGLYMNRMKLVAYEL